MLHYRTRSGNARLEKLAERRFHQGHKDHRRKGHGDDYIFRRGEPPQLHDLPLRYSCSSRTTSSNMSAGTILPRILG